MSVLPTTGHVLAHLRVHMETAAYDAAHTETGNGPLGARYDLWQSCINHVELLESNPAYAAHFSDLVMRRNIAEAHAGDPEGYRAGLAELGLDDHRFLFDEPDAVDGPAARFAAGLDPAVLAAAADGPMARVFGVAAYLQRTAADVPIYQWEVSLGGVRAMVGAVKLAPATSRAVLRMLADRFDLAYSEETRSDDDDRINGTASGDIGGVRVKFWDILPAGDPSGAEPAPFEADPEHTAAIAHHTAVATRLLSLVPAASWSIKNNLVSGMVIPDSVDGARRMLQDIASQLGLEYTEGQHREEVPQTLMFKASGTVDGAEVDIWALQDKPEPIVEEYVEPVGDGMQVRYTVNGPGDYEATLEPVASAADDFAAAAESGVGL